MNSNTIEILAPIIGISKKEKGLAPRVDGFDNKVIGFLNNNWETFDLFGKRIEELFLERYKSSRVIRRTKLEKVLDAPADLIEELATSCHVVINGLCA